MNYKMIVKAGLPLFSIIFMLPGCQTNAAPQNAKNAGIMPSTPSISQRLDRMSADYVMLTLEAGTHEAEYVDAYYGPADIKSAAEADPRTLAHLAYSAGLLKTEIAELTPRSDITPLERRRALALRGMLVAAETRLQMLQGKKFGFADEAKGQFATAPVLKPLTDLDPVLAKLEILIPGTGPLAARVDAFNDRFTIPKDRLQTVFDSAIDECKRRTEQHIALPAGEDFTMEFVTGKTWSGYNYYKGNYQSLIQINTDLPIRISRAVDLGCHEGYPGHHVLNLMTESKLARQNGWKEYEVNPLYSPTSVLSEGSANYGIDLAFPAQERLAFERDVLYPLAGLDPKTAESYWQMQQMTEGLSGARLTIAKMYLDGEVTRAKALELTQKYLLLSPARAEQSIAFTDHYRSYVINYGWGKDLVRNYIERSGADGAGPDAKTRWTRMEKILSEPTLPSDLVAVK
jgi:hypothetical protein